ncbi:MAG: TetR/AcrR family transcriptional regulator [Polyangiaceae bacterium]|nr:TetR/AcrR family transcriptional regulator [Polyangiaceae bacterium]
MASRPKAPRRPVQQRAVLRRESILDATARVLDRVGYDGLTTNSVALEARTAVGSVYQYFRSREALLDGLLERHGRRLGEAIEAAIAVGDPDPLAVADRVVDAFARVWREEPGYRAAWSAKSVSGLLDRTGAAWGYAFTARIGDLLGSFAPAWPAARRLIVARTAVHLVSGILLAAIASPRRVERAMEGEAKLALRAYLGVSLAS